MLDNIELFIIGLAIFDCLAIYFIVRREIERKRDVNCEGGERK